MEQIRVKICSGPCGRELPATEEHFHQRSRNKDGFDGVCKSCKSLANKEYCRDHKSEIRASHLDWVSRNRDRYLSYYRNRNKNRRSEKKDLQLRKQYGISLDQYNQMKIGQGGLCSICGQPETRKINGLLIDLAVDHDHETGKIRGLLCGRCNRDVAVVENRLNEIRKYLVKHKEK